MEIGEEEDEEDRKYFSISNQVFLPKDPPTSPLHLQFLFFRLNWINNIAIPIDLSLPIFRCFISGTFWAPSQLPVQGAAPLTLRNKNDFIGGSSERNADELGKEKMRVSCLVQEVCLKNVILTATVSDVERQRSRDEHVTSGSAATSVCFYDVPSSWRTTTRICGRNGRD